MEQTFFKESFLSRQDMARFSCSDQSGVAMHEFFTDSVWSEWYGRGLIERNVLKIVFSPRHWNTGLVSSRASLTAWGEGASLALVGSSSSDGVTVKMPYGVDVLHWPASHPIFSYWAG